MTDSVIIDAALTEQAGALFRETSGDATAVKIDYITAIEDSLRQPCPG